MTGGGLVPQVYPTGTERATANYNWTDIADGTGVVIFYGASDTDGDQFLQTQVIYSNGIEVGGTAVASGESFNVDFDLTAFNTPKTVKGTAYIEYGHYGAKVNRTGATNMNAYVTFTLYKFDGTTETQIGTNNTYVTFDATPVKRTFCMTLDLTETSFKAGDILRLTAVGTITGGGGGAETGRVVIGSDPKNRDGTYITPSSDSPATITQLILNLPFVIDL